MKEPEIRFHQSFDDHFKECREIDIYIDVKKVKRWIRKYIKEAWQELIKKFDINFIERFDVVIAYAPGIMPLVTRDGVVIRLDLGRVDIKEIDYDDKENIRSYIFHEIYHLADRLDPKFNMDYHKDAEAKQKYLGKVINAVWDLYIERRKFYSYGIRPIYCKGGKSKNKNKIEEESKKDFITRTKSLCLEPKIFEDIFNKVWRQSNLITYNQIYDCSMKICPKYKRWNINCY